MVFAGGPRFCPETHTNWLEEMTLEVIAKEDREAVEKSHGKLALVIADSLPYIGGIVSGTIARLTGCPPVIGVIPAANALTHSMPRTKKGIVTFARSYLKYALGAALPYADKIGEAAQSLIDKL